MATKRRWLRKLKHAKCLARPKEKRPTKGKRAIIDGHRYEEQVARYLKALYGAEFVLHGQWIEYEDPRGTARCQPDIILLPDPPRRKLITVFESKLTWTQAAAEEKLKGIYRPVVAYIWPEYPIKLIQVCKKLKTKTRERTKVVSTSVKVLLEEIALYSVWHWRPK